MADHITKLRVARATVLNATGKPDAKDQGEPEMLNRPTIFILTSLLAGGPVYAQQQPAQQPTQQQQGQNEPREGGSRWQYQSEQSEARTYTQPSFAPSIPLEVEQLRNRTAALEDRVEKLEKALSQAVLVINAQTETFQKLSGK